MRGLSFRGKTDTFGSTNNGNFMMLLEAISEFDPFLAKHIQKFGNSGKDNTSYLSYATYEKITKIMAATVTTTIMKQLEKVKYFSCSVGSTLDITNVDQLSLIVRFVQNNAEPVERFLCFLPNTGHKAEDMLLAVRDTFKKLNIDINNCRGQSYDNVSNMSGQYNGLQAKIKEKCQDDACASLTKDWNQIISALKAIKSDSAYQKVFVKNEATGLLAQLNSLETAILSEFLGSVLKQFNITTKTLQGVDTDVEVVSRLYESLITFVENKRETFDAFEAAGKKIFRGIQNQ
ncbi:hypothetical protein RN001_003400 [Aquatica leii]|uniref:DUF4371 domain-containing protein n=1 Tax=Aquatica leii TaxID=1421715 RepID=A0AAN7SMA4_9COLE|nr:hypothetical protein RN001_003400 [Aquatica leii]